jgi:hypothetical protein
MIHKTEKSSTTVELFLKLNIIPVRNRVNFPDRGTDSGR